ncbi:putative aminopeptidase-2 [Temnothorax nylanderi]|uniref:putative aminopeptidase-2 n=1 Tax=Temnothorax nylanderi TaxID=102681 RepID=UPI003A848B0C
MELLKLLLFGNLLFIAVKAITDKVSLDEDNRIDRESIELIQYDIELITYIDEKDYKNIDIDNKFKSYIDEQRAKGNFIFQGQSTMFFRLKSEDVNRIYLHIQNLKIDEAATEINYISSDGINTIYKPRMHEYDKKTQTVALYVDDVVLYNIYNYRLIMKFVGRITNNTGSFFKIPYINDQREKKWFIAAADFHGAGAREIFPCWDEPDIRTNFNISIKNNQKYIALSNSPITDYESTDDSWMIWTRFNTTYNISAYHVAVVLSDLYHISENVWGRKSVESHIEFARKVAENATLYLNDTFYKPPFPPKVDHIVVPGFRDEGLESWGLVLYREAAIIYDEKLDPIAWKIEVARMVARKMVHQLYGNLISQSWWSYMWLNEGIASFLAMKIIKEYINPQYPDLFAVQFQYESLRLNDYYDMPLASKVATPEDINSLFSFTYYVKAPAFIRILEQTVSPSTFQIGLDDYLNEYQFRSIDISTNTADKFFDLLQATLLPYNHIKYANLKKKLSEWPKQKRFPILEMTQESSDLIKIKLSDEYVNETYGQYLWTYVTYTTYSYSQSRSNEENKWLSPHNPHFYLTDINKNDCIIVNERLTGYYRVNYDKDNWEKLINYLNSEKYSNIHVLNRAQIIDDAYYFLLRNKLDFHFFKNLTYYLSRETNYVAWYPMFKIMEEVSGFFPFPESTEIKKHLQRISESVLRKIEYTDKVKRYDFTECLRQEAAKWACNLDSSECTHSAHLKLTSLHKKRLSPIWKEWTYCKGLMSASNISWNEVLHSAVLDNDLLRFLACTKNHTVIIGYLDLLKSGRFTKAQHRITVFHSIIARHARNDLVLDHIINNFSNVVPREIKKIVALIDIINHLYSRDQLDKVKINEFKVYDYAQNNFFNKMFTHIIQKINVRLSEITKHVGYFKNFLKTELPDTRIIMELLKLLLGVNLIFIAIKAVTGKVSLAEVNCRRGMQSLNILGYDIDLTPYINEDDYKNTTVYEKFKSYIDEQRARGNFVFYGESTMYFRFRNKLNKICLHALNLEVDGASIKIVFTLDGINNTSHIPRIHTYDKETQIIGLYFDDLWLPDSYTYHITMKFVGRITDITGGFVKTSYINNEGEKTWFIAAADFQGIGARQIFPCWDEPDVRTNFVISINHHSKYTVLSNSPIDQVFTDDYGMVHTRFQTTDKISPYQVAVVLSELEHIPNTTVWCRQNVKQQINFAQQVAENATLYLKGMFPDGQFPSKVDHVVVPGFRDEGLKSWGLILYRETAIIYDEKLDFIAWKFEVARTVTRKMVHQFFGNLVGESWWSYLWLNEGIASFLAMEIVNKYVHSHLTDLLTVQFQHESLRLNDYYDMPLVSDVVTPSDINSLFSFTYYVKAPIFVRSLLQIVSIDAFKTGLNRYLNTYQLKSINASSSTTDKFFGVLQEVLENSNESNINLTIKLTYWTKQRRYPILDITRKSAKDDVEITLQEYFDESYVKNLGIPVTYITQSAPNITKKRWMNPYKQILYLPRIKTSDWIIVNVQQTGYYRVNYDYNNWQKLMKYLNSEEYRYIHVLNRAQIIDDAYYFLLNNKLDIRFFKNLTYYLSSETNYVAWYPMFKIMEEVSSFFPFPQSMEIKEHFQKILESVLSEIGYVDRMKENVFTKCLRQEAAKWACTLNSSQCTTAAVFDSMWFYRQPEPILPGWKEWVYCKGMMVADNATWNDVWNAGISDNKLLKFLACSENHTIIIDYIDRLKSGYFTKAQHRITVFHSIITRHAKNDLVLDYILKNFTNIVPREIDKFIALTDIINHVYSDDQLSKLHDCAQNNLSKKMFEYVMQKIDKRSFEIREHVYYFKHYLMTNSILKPRIIMELLKLLLDVILIFISVKGASGSSLTEVYCVKDTQPIEVIGYNVELTPYINTDDYKHTDTYTKFKSYINEQQAKGNFIFYGESAISFKCTGQTSKICLNAINLEIDKTATKIIHFHDDGSNVTYVPWTHVYHEQSQTIGLYFKDVLEPDHHHHTYRLIMKFVGSITDDTGGFVKTSYLKNDKEKTWFIAAADFRGIGARQIFPCWDEPDIRTTFTISIKNHHKNYTAISNSPVYFKVANKDDMVSVSTYFETTFKISPYHVAVVLSNLDKISKNVWGRKIVEPHIKFVQSLAENAKLYLKNMFHEGHVPPKVDHVVVPGFRDEGLESWGLVLYREATVTYNESLDSIATKFEVARIVAHKMAHQYFSNLIGQTRWNYLWLNEGIATFLSMKIVKEFVHFQLMDLLAVQFQHESLRLNDHYDMPLVPPKLVIAPSDVTSLFSFTYYVKAPVFIRSLLQIIPEERFIRGLNSYLSGYQLRSVESINTINIFFDPLQRMESYDLARIMNEWTTRINYPILQVTRDSSEDKLEITSLQYRSTRSHPKNLSIPVTYITQSAFNGTKLRWLTPETPIVHLTEIKKNEWIIVNVQQIGYYRVNYDNDNWQKLMEYLNYSEKYVNIHVLNRAQIIDDAYYFLLKNQLNFRLFKSLTYYLSRETNYVAWYPMFKILEQISGFFPYPESTEIKEHFQIVLDLVLAKIGYASISGDMSKDDDFIKYLRQEVVKWACILNSEQCENVANRELKLDKGRSTVPGMRKWKYCNGLMSADNTFWNKMLKTEVLDNNLLKSLACTKDHAIIVSYLNLLKSGHFTEAQHRITVFHSIIARHARNNLVLDHIMLNFRDIVPREIDTFVALIDIVNHVYSVDQLFGKVYEYVLNNISKTDKMFSYFVKKANIRALEIGDLPRYFKNSLTTK